MSDQQVTDLMAALENSVAQARARARPIKPAPEEPMADETDHRWDTPGDEW